MEEELPSAEADQPPPPYHGNLNSVVSEVELPVPWDHPRRYIPDEVVQSIQGTVLSEDGRIAGYIPKRTYQYISSHVLSQVDAQHNAQMVKAMRETSMTERWWRFNHFSPELDPGANFWGFVVVTLGVGLVLAPLWLWHPKKKKGAEPERVPLRDMTIGFQQKGWIIKLVPQIKINWDQVYENFADLQKMQNIAVAVQRQEPLQGADARPEWGVPLVCPTAPGGEWARENEYHKNQRIRLRFNHMWLFTFNKKNIPTSRSVEHGIVGPTTISVASSLLMIQERNLMRELLKSGFKGMAVAMWPPAEILDEELEIT